MYGKLGLGTEVGHTSPVRVDALAAMRVTMVACGSRHTAALLSTGEVSLSLEKGGLPPVPP